MRICLALLICVLSISTAHAFDVKGLQPLAPYGVFSTFSAESLKQNKVGFGLTVDKSVDPNFYRTVLQFAYGLHDRFEINATFSYILGYGNSIDGAEDLCLGVKHRILNEETYTPAIAYMLTLSAPTGREEFTTNGNYGGGLVFTKKVGPFKGHLNALYSKPQKSGLKSEYLLNMGADIAITNNSKILGELITRKNYDSTKLDLLEWRLGYRIETVENFFTTIGIGFNTKNREPEYRFVFSLSIILPPEKRAIQRIYE